MDRGYSIRYQPPLYVVFVLVILMSTFFLYSFYQPPTMNTASNIKTNSNPNEAKQTQPDNSQPDDNPPAAKVEPESPTDKNDIQDQQNNDNNNQDIRKANNINHTEGSFKDGRTFEWLYSKSLESPLYPKPFPKLEEDKEKMEAVKEAFLHAWNNYDQNCFGADAFRPLSKGCGNGNLHGGLTIIDSLSTIIIMGLEGPYLKSLDFVNNSFRPSGSWSLFEFIIRYLGGLISAYSLSHNDVFKDAAVGLGEAIYPIIDRTGGFFSSSFSLSTSGKNQFSASGAGGGSCLAESGTFQVEFAALTEMTGDSKFLKAGLNVYRSLWGRNPSRGLISSHIGAGTDSYYEYIPKLYVQTGGTCPRLIRRHEMFMNDVRNDLIFHTAKRNLTGIGTSGNYPRIEHLATFAGGMCAVGSVTENKNHEEDLQLGREVAMTYGETYAYFKSGIMPEHVSYNKDSSNGEEMRLSVDGYILRPETVETIFYLWRFTGDPIYREYNWKIFKAINKSCRVDNGFASIRGVDNENPHHVDEMESFFLAETLKYLYLTFADSSLISQAEWVFNTEAHPIHQWSQETIDKFKDELNDYLGSETPPGAKPQKRNRYSRNSQP